MRQYTEIVYDLFSVFLSERRYRFLGSRGRSDEAHLLWCIIKGCDDWMHMSYRTIRLREGDSLRAISLRLFNNKTWVLINDQIHSDL